MRKKLARWSVCCLGVLACLTLGTPSSQAGVFDALPHLKRPTKPLASQYGPCYGHYQVTYRQWPTECLLNPIPARRPNPYSYPVPGGAPEEPVPEAPGGPVSGILFEIQEDPAPVVPVSATQPRTVPYNTNARR